MAFQHFKETIQKPVLGIIRTVTGLLGYFYNYFKQRRVNRSYQKGIAFVAIAF